jgi:hypothetical protein
VTATWLFANRYRIYYVEATSSKVNSWRVRIFKENESDVMVETLNKYFADEDATVNEFKSVIFNDKNNFLLISAGKKSSQVKISTLAPHGMSGTDY